MSVAWESSKLEDAYQILWELRQKQDNTKILRAIADAMDAIERVDDYLVQV